MQMLIAMTSGADGMALLGASGVAPFWHFAGAFHPVVVHFPIALLMVAAFLEGLIIARKRSVVSPVLSPSALTCLWLGTAGAIVASALGWASVNAEGGGVGDDTSLIAVHRWTGVALAGTALLAAVASAFARQRPAPRRVLAYRGGVMASAALVGLVGMYGGKITHGADHYDNAVKTLMAELGKPTTDDTTPALADATTLPSAPPAAPATQPAVVAATQPAPNELTAAPDAPEPATLEVDPVAPELVPTTAPTSAPSQTPTTSTAATVPGTRLTFARDIKPIFDTACAKCHNAAKQKSGYRLDDRAAAMLAGDSGEKPIVPGRASESFLIKLVEGHGEFADKRMPTKGPPLTGDQIAMIRRWIDEGAE